MIGKTVSHYKILEKLGEGGMGLVYKAEDLKLQRPVALKFLPAHLTADQHARQRFEREAQAAAKLNHPNIVVIYDIGEFENQIYIAMEFVEGQTLDQFLSAGPLPIDQASEFVIAIADALALAHRKGIVHRDVKPGNIMVSSGNDARPARQIKVMDFGLAILKGLSSLTDDGTVVGTLAYMSPEQARGQKVDQRSDIFSLGSVFYEMLTGSPPFIGEYQAAILYGIVNEEPISLSEKRPGISKDLERIVAKTLAKEIDKRYQNMGELLAKLADYQYKPQTLLEKAGPEKKSIAVMPFEDISPGKQNEYLADGMSEELIMTLSQNRQLRVIARTSVMQYKSQVKDVREIGRELGVSYVLEGSVRRIEDQLRITAQLIDTVDGSHLWADKYDGGMSDIFAFQEQVASQVSGALKVELGQDKLEIGNVLAHRKLSPRSLKIPGWGILSRLKLQRRAVLNVPTHISHVHSTAYEYYLKGKLLQDAPTLQNLDNSVLMLERALQLDHRYAAAYGSLSSAYLWYIDTGLKPDPQYLSKAEEAAQRALSIDPNQSDALYTFANLAMKSAKIVEAVSGFANVLEADPNHRNARLWQAVLIYMSSYLERALQEADQLLAIDPYWPMAHWLHSTIRLHLGMFDAAMAEYEQMVSEVPSKLVWLTLAYLYVGKMDLAWQAAHKVQQLEPEGILWPMAFAFIEGAEGKGKKILDYVDERVRAYGWDFNIATYWVASFYAMASEKDDAFRWLDRAIEIGNRNYRWFEADPNLENLHDDPRFIEVLSKARSKSLNLESLLKENIQK